jgi:KRAB domain-containing zinc finger protein
MTENSSYISTNTLEIQDFQCDHCDKVFTRNTTLKDHINAIHNKIKRYCCDLCDYSAYYRTSLNRHSKDVHLGGNKEEFKCDHCDKAFTRKETLVYHVNIIHKNIQEFQCDHCDKAFGRNDFLQDHINAIHNNIKRFSCDLCDYSSYYKKYLVRHSKAVHCDNVKEVFKCDSCDKTFTWKVTLVKHVNTKHKKLRKYSCQLCTYTSYDKRALKYHSNAVHLGKKDYRCTQCNKTFTRRESLVGHIDNVHKKIRRYSCQVCNYTSYFKFDMIKHLKRHHPNNVQTHDLDTLMKEAHIDQMFVTAEAFSSVDQNDKKCFEQVNVLEEVLETKEIEIKEELLDDVDAVHKHDLDALMKEAQKDQMFVSETCSSAAAVQSDQNSFVQVNVIEEILESKEIEIKEALDSAATLKNLKIPEFQCEHCDKVFDQNGFLQTHIKVVHKKIRRFFCDFCDFSSYHNNVVELHSKTVHLGNKDFKCTQCDKAFTRKESLGSHVNNVHKKIRRYSCQVCHYTSYFKVDMIKHLKRHPNNGQTHDLTKEAQKDQMFVSAEAFSSVDQNDKKCFEQVNVLEEVLETKEIEIKEELLDDVAAVHIHDLDIWQYTLMKEAEKDQMFVSVERCKKNLPETCSSAAAAADQSDQNCFVQVNVIEDILESKEIEIKEALDNAATLKTLKIPEFQCEHCDKVFDQNGFLQTHIKVVHKKIRRFFCDLCDFSSYRNNVLELHFKTVHLGNKDFKCTQCDKAFTRRESLRSHVNSVHKKIRRYSCQVCNYTSYFKNEVKKHLKRHLNNVLNSETLSKKDSLNQLINLTHMNIKRQRCDLSSKSDLKRPPNNVQTHDLGTSMKEAEKDEMFDVSVEKPEACSSADQNDKKCFVQVNVIEEVLETKELLDNVAENDPLAIVKQEEPF